MTLFQVGPRPNAVSCLLDPTRLPPGQIHCEPRLLVGDRSLRATGAPSVLRDLMNARQEAQSRGITIEGTVSGASILVRSVNFTRRATPPPSRPVAVPQQTSPVAVARLARMVQAPPTQAPEVLWETVIDGVAIQLTAARPGGV